MHKQKYRAFISSSGTFFYIGRTNSLPFHTMTLQNVFMTKNVHLMKGIFVLVLLSMCTFARAQVTVLPEFPTAEDEVTITFDATKGNGALVGVRQIYAHTGVITDKSKHPNDWRYVQGNWGKPDNRVKMKNIGGNKHQITYKLRKYYGVPSSEKILKMAFVFRNADGSLVGRAENGSDIFTEVYENTDTLLLNVQSPGHNNIILSRNEAADIALTVSKSAIIRILDNDRVIIHKEGQQLDTSIVLAGTGKHDIRIEACSEGDTVFQSFRFAVNPDVLQSPTSVEPGVNVTSDSSATLVLYAPGKSFVYVLGTFNDFLLDEKYYMHYSPSNHRWWIEIDGLDPEEEYAFYYYVDGKINVADPFSQKVLDPWNDLYIPDEVYPGLMPYPTDRSAGILTAFRTKKDDFDWEDAAFENPPKSRLNIYELLLRDFLKSHSFNELSDTLDYLNRLGINAIELMPVNEFEGNESWGYNPSFHMALDKYYGTREAFKNLVNEAHKRGIAVILDVVYNHVFSQSPLAQLYWDSKKFRPAPNNPWLNVTPRHPFNVGYDFNHESSATKYYVDRCLVYWMEEFHIDGFRFDLSKGFTQKFSANNGQMSAYDQSRIDILSHYAKTIWNTRPGTYVILEHFAENREEQALVAKGMMVWGNNNYQFAEASMGYDSDLSASSYKARGFSVPGLISYMESHDEERIMYKTKTWGNAHGSYDVKALPVALQRAGLAAVFNLIVPGPKMMWQFGELGYDYSINRCEDGTISDRCRLSPKPIRWDYYREKDRKKLFDLYAQMHRMRKEMEIFQSNDFTMSVSAQRKRILLRGTNSDLILIGNFGVVARQMKPYFTKTGMWYEIFSGDSIYIDNKLHTIAVPPGEFRLFSSKKISTAVKSPAGNKANTPVIYPNPATDVISVALQDKDEKMDWDIYDLSGNLRMQGRMPGSNTINIRKLPEGMYYLLLKRGLQTPVPLLFVKQ